MKNSDDDIISNIIINHVRINGISFDWLIKSPISFSLLFVELLFGTIGIVLGFIFDNIIIFLIIGLIIGFLLGLFVGFKVKKIIKNDNK